MTMNPEWVEQMAELDQTWSERFPMRLARRHKEQFLHELETLLNERQFSTERVGRRRLLWNENLVTRCEQPDVIFLAHYDTPTIIPFWLSAVLAFFGHTRQMLAGMFIVFVLYLVPPLLRGTGSPIVNDVLGAVELLIFLSLLVLLIPNPRNREDNTSGVLGLVGLAEWLRDKPALRDRVQLAFLDNEEWGLLGSATLKSWWQQTSHPYTEAAIVNLDCISRGRAPLVVHHGDDSLAARLLPYIQHHLPAATVVNSGVVPLSDNFTFRELGAVDISLADPATLPGGYYIPRIHTPRDSTFTLERFTLLIDGLCAFIAAETAARREGRTAQLRDEPAPP